eukprot:TRINITY_DN22_c0_g2_i1.p1 TRINITY_DN22_c0_g2~~TRINITY_DN22_c0_g2_i1.p1  ORF type:complete len:126 (-),score=25.95 TRINITY_DN22_c0_g2_i1:129-506(-)
MKAAFIILLCLAILFAAESAKVRFRSWNAVNCPGNPVNDVSVDIDQCLNENSVRLKINQFNSSHYGLNMVCNDGCTVCQIPNLVIPANTCFSEGGTSFWATSAASSYIVPTLVVFFGLILNLCAF